MSADEQTVRRNPDVSHERSDMNFFGVAVAVTATLLTTLTIVGLLWFYFQYLRSGHESIADVFGIPERFRNMTREPVLQQSPTRDLEEFRRQEYRKLHSYSWTDRTRGIVSIPIDRAIQSVLRNGLPAAENMPGLQLGVPMTTHRQTGFDRFVNSPQESR